MVRAWADRRSAMIEETLPFGERTIRVTLPDRARVVPASTGSSRLEPGADQAAAVSNALPQPLGLPRVGQLVRPGAKVLIAFDDPTTPSFGPMRRPALEGILPSR